MKIGSLKITAFITSIIAIICYVLFFTLPWGYETHISDNEYIYETSIFPFLSLILGIIITTITIISGAKIYFEKNKDKSRQKMKKLVIFFTTGFITGVILIIVGIFLIFIGLGCMGGISVDFIIGLIILEIGIILIIGFLLLIAINSNYIKRNIGIGCLLIFVMFLSILLFTYANYEIDNSYYMYEPSPSVSCQIDSYNDSANMIKWVVIKTYSGVIKNEYLGYRLMEGADGYNIIKANISYYDVDDSNTLTKGDIFEVYAPSDGIYNFQIIDWYTNSLACEYSNSY